MMSLNTKWLVATFAVLVFTIGFESETHAQRGVRIGNFFQAGGGQGFRLGGPRAGMHFGGGQGATIGTQRFGMRFGNGQGARFGGQQYGMQFGGGQGTQIGRLATAPSVAPGTYYYGTPQGVPKTSMVNPRSNVIQPSVAQPTVAQPTVPQLPKVARPGIAPRTTAAQSPNNVNSLQQLTSKLANPGNAVEPNPAASASPASSPAAEVFKESFKDPATDAPGQRKTKVYSVLNKEAEVQESLSPAKSESDK